MSGQINIKWKADVGEGVRSAVRGKRGLRHRRMPLIEDAMPEWQVHELPPGIAKKDEEDILRWLNNHGAVLFAEPEGFGTLIEPVEIVPFEDGSAQSVDAFNEWYQKFLGIPAARTVSRGAGVTIAVLDNGITPPHVWNDPRLAEQKLFRMSETNGTLGGSHGQPVMGLVSAAADEAKCTNYKIGGSSDVKCSWTDVSNAGLYAKQQGHKVINLSYIGGSSLLLQDTLAKLKAAGIAVIVSAGNTSTATQFPANNANAYAVSALDEAGNIAGFSCRGKIDICAPGVSLLTSIPGGGWAAFSGTSGAAPLVSGLLALILSKNPSWSGVQAMQHLMATATPKLPATDYGAGIPNAPKAVGAAETTPPPTEPPPTKPPVSADTSPPSKVAQPTISEKTPGGFRASWVAATDNAGVVKHRLYLDTVAIEPDVLMPGLTWLFTGLVPGRTYNVQIRAMDAADNISAHSDPLHVTLPMGDLPPPTETWEPKSTETVDRSLYSPAIAAQSCTVVTTITSWEESNLGNKRNETVATVTTTETRTVPLPTM